MTTFYQVPRHDTAPSEEMIEWLHQMTQEWDGDESGVTITSPSGESSSLAGPGDAIVEHGGVYRVYTQPDMHALAAAVACDCWPEEVTPDQRRAAKADAYHRAYGG